MSVCGSMTVAIFHPIFRMIKLDERWRAKMIAAVKHSKGDIRMRAYDRHFFVNIFTVQLVFNMHCQIIGVCFIPTKVLCTHLLVQLRNSFHSCSAY